MKYITGILLASVAAMFISACGGSDVNYVVDDIIDDIVDDDIGGEDNVAPIITLNGDVTVHVTLGTPYTDAGATATDNVDPSVTVLTSGVELIDVNVPDTYTVTYTATDTAGNIGTAYRTVIVVEEEIVITGTLDSTFGTDGIVVHDEIVSDSTGSDMILDGSGNIYAVGYGIYSNPDFKEMVIWKYDSTGVLDDTFGTGGVATNEFTAPAAVGGYGTSQGFSIDLDASGNIYVTGNIYNAATVSWDMAIWKFDSSGNPDSTFGTDGLVTHDGAAGGNVGDLGMDIVLDGSGNIYVTGDSTNSAGDKDMVIWKYDGTGTLDSTFGTGGFVVSGEAAGGTNSNDGGSGIQLDASGNIFVVGYGNSSAGDYDMIIWKYDSTGTLDSTFGTGGIVVSDGAIGYANAADDGWQIVLDGSGNIYVTGNSGEYTGSFTGDRDMVIWKFDSSGTPDSTFGTGGIVVHAGAAGGTNDYDTGQAIELDGSGNIYVAGYSANSAGNNDMVIWKYDGTGTLDSTFGTGGIVVSGGVAGNENADDIPSQIRLDGSGNLYVVGTSAQSGQDSDVMVIWNYN